MPISREILKKYSKWYSIFIETGTHTGTTVNLAIEVGFKNIYTIELSDKYYKRACGIYKNNKNVHCIFGDSSIMLPKLLESVKFSCVFWLDGHWSKGDTALGAKRSPLIEELNSIRNHNIKNHMILIDDISLMSKFYALEINDIVEKIFEINESYKIIFERGRVDKDILIAAPKDYSGEKFL